MDPLTPLALGNLYDPIPVQIRRRLAEVERVRTAQGMLRFAVGVGVERGDLDAVLGGRAADASDLLDWFDHREEGGTYRAISPRLAIRIEFRAVVSVEASVDAARARVQRWLVRRSESIDIRRHSNGKYDLENTGIESMV
jgi:hypothetical protein